MKPLCNIWKCMPCLVAYSSSICTQRQQRFLVTFTSHRITHNNRHIPHLHMITATYIVATYIVATALQYLHHSKMTFTSSNNVYNNRHVHNIYTRLRWHIAAVVEIRARNCMVGRFGRSDLAGYLLPFHSVSLANQNRFLVSHMLKLVRKWLMVSCCF